MVRWGKGKDPSPEESEEQGNQPGTKDAFCTECGTWYDSNNQSEVNRHAH